MRTTSNRAISNKRQLAALASPVRQELMDLLTRAGPLSPAELGRLLQRPADGLYYHLRALVHAGLVVAASGGGNGARYRTASSSPHLNHDPAPGGNSKAVSTIVAAMLRLGIRDFRAAAANPVVRTGGPRRELWAMRTVGWLTATDLTQANVQMRALRDAVSKRPSRGKLYGITILLTPLSHRGRKRQSKPRAAGSRAGS